MWIQRINAASRAHGLSYSQMMHGLKILDITLDRKQLAFLAAEDADGFQALALRARDALATLDKQAV